MALDTIFLTATSDARSDETEAEWTAMIRQLIGRVGDNTFSKHLKQAESEVRQRVLDLLHGAQPLLVAIQHLRTVPPDFRAFG